MQRIFVIKNEFHNTFVGVLLSNTILNLYLVVVVVGIHDPLLYKNNSIQI